MDQALDSILAEQGPRHAQDGNVVWIAPRDELATREKLRSKRAAAIADLDPPRTESFQILPESSRMQAAALDPAQTVLSKRGSAVVDVRTNTLFVQDTPTPGEVRRLIQGDIPVRQVMIESRIVEATDSFIRNLASRLGITTGPAAVSPSFRPNPCAPYRAAT